MDDCSNRAALLGEERLLGSLAPCLFFNFGGRDACCASAQDLLANDTADAELDLELCLCQPEYLAVMDDLLSEYDNIMSRQTVFNIFSECQIPHIRDDGVAVNCPAE